MIKRWTCNCSPYGDGLAVDAEDYASIAARLHEWEITEPGPTIIGLNDELRQVKARLAEAERREDDWHRWAREVCTDFREPFDNHTVGLRLAIAAIMHRLRATDSASVTQESKA